MLRSRQICLLLAAFAIPIFLRAQDGDPSLGDVAREARQAKANEPSNSGQKVIDNDNFSAVLDEAEAARISGKPVFSIAPSGNAFRMTSPDGTCSLSFDAKATALISSSFVSSDLPQDDLAKLEGHALLHDDTLEISVHNASPWELRELLIGITVLQKSIKPDGTDAFTELRMATDPSWTGKLPDSTTIVHLRGSVAANSTGSFTAVLGAESSIPLGNTTDWHWALVSARGIPPASSQTLQNTAAATSSNSPELQGPTAPASAIVSATAPAPAPPSR